MEVAVMVEVVEVVEVVVAADLPRRPQIVGGRVAELERRHVVAQPASEALLAHHRVNHPHDRAALAVRNRVEDLLDLLRLRDRHLDRVRRGVRGVGDG